MTYNGGRIRAATLRIAAAATRSEKKRENNDFLITRLYRYFAALRNVI